MKKITLLLIGIFLVGILEFTNAQAPFSRGVNLTGWFQTSNPRQIQFSKYSKKDFENIKSLGCDAIRLPINLFYMTNGSPDYTIDPLFFSFLDQAVDWAESLQMYLIIDNHSSDDIASQNPNLETELSKVWIQMADHYKARSSYILYEIMNEPNGTLTTSAWGRIQQTAITAIRTKDNTHTIVVGGAGYNSYNELTSLPVYTDTKLLYTFHFYDPFVFTHQGATWPNPSMASLANVPFPYNAATMPSVPADLVGTWVGSSINNYQNDGTVAKVKSLIDIAVAFKTSRNVNIYCGEFGVYNLNSKDADRVNWYNEVRKYLEVKGIAWTIWDYQGGFGLFKKGSNEQFNYDLNIPMVTALGLIAPAQQGYVMKPDSVGFKIYTDYVGEKITEASNASGGTVDFYSNDKPNNGNYCLSWTNCTQYGTVGFNFSPDKDLSTLKAQNYALSFLVRGNSPGTTADLRFTDTKTSSTDHPWRMNFTMTETNAKWDNLWHKVYIPLSQFVEGGSWDGSYYKPIGAFDWKAVDRFDIVAEQMALTNKKFWFDNIQISNMDTAQIYVTSTFSGINEVKSTSSTFSIFPNPCSFSATINYSLFADGIVNINIFNLAGQKVESIFNDKQTPGNHSVKWVRGPDFKQGIYLCVISKSNLIMEQKMIVI